MVHYHPQKHRLANPRISPKERFTNDLQYKEVAFVFSVTINRDAVGSNIHKTYATVPQAINCAYQEDALSSQNNDPGTYGNRIIHIFTRFRHYVKWKDLIVVRNMQVEVVSVLDRFHNADGSYHHTEIRAVLKKDEDNIQRAP
jgi:hypothetical protein